MANPFSHPWSARRLAGLTILPVTLLAAACGEAPDTAATPETVAATLLAEATTLPSSSTSAAPILEAEPTTTTAPPGLVISGLGQAIPLVAGPDDDQRQITNANAVATSAQGTIAIATSRGTVVLFSNDGSFFGTTDQTGDSTECEDTSISSLAFLGDTERLVGTCDDGNVMVWSGSEGAWTPEMWWQPLSGQPSTQVASDPSGQFVVTADADFNVRVWDIADLTTNTANPEAHATLGRLSGPITQLDAGNVDTSGNPLVSVSVADASGTSVEVFSNGERNTIRVSEGIVSGLALTADGTQVALSGPPTPVWANVTDSSTAPMDWADRSDSQTTAIAAWGSPDGGDSLIAVAGSAPYNNGDAGGSSGVDQITKGTMQLVTTESRSALTPFEALDGGIVALAFLPDGSGVVAATKRQAVIIPIVFG